MTDEQSKSAVQQRQLNEAAALLRTQHERITALEADRAALKAALEWVIQYFEAAPEQLTNAREWLVAARAALRDIR